MRLHSVVPGEHKFVGGQLLTKYIIVTLTTFPWFLDFSFLLILVYLYCFFCCHILSLKSEPSHF